MQALPSSSCGPPSTTLSARARRLVGDLQHRLAALGHEDLAAGPVPAWFAPALRELIEGESAIAYRPAHVADGVWSLGEQSTTHPSLFARYDALLQTAAQGSFQPFQYAPLRPPESQRNRACTVGDIHHHGPEESCIIEEVWPALGLGGHDQLRALVCEGPVLLAWVGGFRSAPFTLRDKAALDALVPALQRTLGLRRRLVDAGLTAAGLSAAMEALAAPAFVVSALGSVSHANAAATALMERSRAEVTVMLRASLAGRGPNPAMRLQAPGMPERWLVVVRDAAVLVEMRLWAAVRRWSITSRESAVLRLLAAGDANKEIAVKLACAEVTVERHVTSLLRKAGCDGRSRLVAAFWMGG